MQDHPDFEGLREEISQILVQLGCTGGNRLPEESNSPAELLCLGDDYDNSPTDLTDWPDI